MRLRFWEFVRLVGVPVEVYEAMPGAVEQQTHPFGRPPRLTLAESFWATVKTECFDNFRDGIPKTRAQTLRALFHTIELFTNRERLHSALGYKSPVPGNKAGHNQTSHRYSTLFQGNITIFHSKTATRLLWASAPLR